MKNNLLFYFFSIAVSAVLALTACSSFSNHAGRSDTRQTQVQNANNSNVHTEARFGGGSFARPGGSPSGTIGGTYHSGYRSPSPNVTNPTAGTRYPAPAAGGIGGGLWPHLGTFGAGMLLGSIFHPFGGGYGYGYGGGFSLFGTIFWIIILFLGYKALRRLFSRNRM